MSVKWTEKQQKVIGTKGKNLLVSAAAGSGKTAVLVERIIQMITDSNNPVDIDKLLVVTFTNAAAAQMREKILEAIQKKSEADPENEHILKQITYIHNAKITTIHSFCLSVIREHFNEIDIDPCFRVADEGELTLLKSDVAKDMLEDYYSWAGEEFFEFIETYATGKGDDYIDELIIMLYTFSMSHPWPFKWLEYCKNNYYLSSEEIFNTSWMKHLILYINILLEDYKKSILNAIEICKMDDGPYMYEEALQGDIAIINNIIKIDEFDKRVALLTNCSFATLSRKRDEGVSTDKKEEIKRIRDKVKKGIVKIKESYYFQSKENMLKDIKDSAEPTNMLIELAGEFNKRYTQAKRDNNIVDFNDIEHLAFEILINTDKNGDTSPTSTAMELAECFDEVIIDEYQDSNLLQELILKSVSKEQFGRPNIFMVGDVKQSIYKFRMAKPELFVEKYNNYSLSDETSYQRINLDKNFRSRDNVLKSINFIFAQIMAKYLGDIDYDKENELYTGSDYKELPDGQSDDTEVLLIDTNGEDGKELEAQVIAKRIHEIVDINNGLMVTDKDTGEYRRAKFSDIVILYRSLTGHAVVTEETLMAEGIPCYLETKEGYFNALEIRILLSLLSIIDNPIQDIPLAAVLKSPIVGLNSMDLAQIKVENPKESFYIALKLYSNCGSNQVLKNKINDFFNKLDEYRTKAAYLSIYELLTFVLNDTGYLLYVTAMPSGDRRKANIDMLKEKAIEYEKTSYTGVFNFIRYIEKLKKYKVDFAEASIINENDNTVRIMSIHKSKGLEFPIVILGGTGKKFNIQDLTSKVILHSEYGIGVDFVDINSRQKVQTLIKKSISLRLKLENLSEELRVLYVALTRAKEKLIITGSAKNIEKSVQKWLSERYTSTINLAFETLISSSNYMDWIGYALIRHSSFSEIYKRMNVPVNFNNLLYDYKAGYVINWLNTKDIVYQKVKDTMLKDNRKENLLHWNSDYIYDDKMKEELKSRLDFKYPYGYNRNIHTKMSVSEIKKLSQTIDNDDVYLITQDNNLPEESIPSFISEKTEVSKSDIGSAYHRVFELLDFSIEDEQNKINEYINKLVSEGKLSQRYALTVDSSVLVTLLKSNLGSRLKNAFNQNKLYREKQYVMGISASHINKDIDCCDNDEIVLIQGIIDAYFEEDGLIIVDYKTDRVDNGERLIQRYKVQLDYYEKALEQITGKKVKEKIIYSLYLGKEVVVQ